MRKAEISARRKFHQSSAAGYEPVGEVIGILQSSDNFAALKEELNGLPAKIETSEPADMVDPLSEFSKKFDNIAGSSDVKSAISKARRALRSKTPDKEKALMEIANAIEIYDAQTNWREQGVKDVLPGLLTYEAEIKHTIGIRQQAKLTENQALDIAGCLSGHRDISLNF